jgi:hypothetical protein
MQGLKGLSDHIESARGWYNGQALVLSSTAIKKKSKFVAYLRGAQVLSA